MTKYCDNIAQLWAGRRAGKQNHNYQPAGLWRWAGRAGAAACDVTRLLTLIIIKRVTIITKYCQNKQENFPPQQHNSTNSPTVFSSFHFNTCSPTQPSQPSLASLHVAILSLLSCLAWVLSSEVCWKSSYFRQHWHHQSGEAAIVFQSNVIDRVFRVIDFFTPTARHWYRQSNLNLEECCVISVNLSPG